MNPRRAVPQSAIVLVSLLLWPTTSRAASCESLTSLTLEHTTITMAQLVAAGELSLPAAGRAGQQQSNAFKQLPAFCRVAATLKPTSDSDIKIELWLPASNWNTKFQAVGNGGWAGTISYPAMAQALQRGYATSSTDTGHSTAGGSFTLGHPEKFIDFAYRSEHEMTVKAKAIIAAFYGNAPRFSYWNGCSTGGRQGLAEAQKYPDDFDGIIAGAQANPRTRLNAWQLSLATATLIDKASVIPQSKYPVIHRAVLDACDARDGVTDGLISNPLACTFDPQVLACKGGVDAPDCLTAPQVNSARTVMSPARTKNGKEIFPGLAPGTELAWAGLVGGPEASSNAVEHYRYIVFKDPNWDWRTFDLDRDLAKADAVDNGTINHINPDLRPFSGRGGKLLMYHGWSDASVAPGTSIDYYNSVNAKMGGASKTSSWMRLFMVPGMGHCGGGEGPNTFDMVSALEQWVEHGKAPDRVIASRVTAGKVERTRPLCAHPQVATYTGRGSTDDAANFVCK